jgi:hypothetical protein
MSNGKTCIAAVAAAILFGLGTLGSLVALDAQRKAHNAEIGQVYLSGLEAGKLLARSERALEPAVAPAPEAPRANRGPLDLDKLRTYGATGQVKCYTESLPAKPRIDLPPRPPIQGWRYDVTPERQKP